MLLGSWYSNLFTRNQTKNVIRVVWLIILEKFLITLQDWDLKNSNCNCCSNVWTILKFSCKEFKNFLWISLASSLTTNLKFYKSIISILMKKNVAYSIYFKWFLFGYAEFYCTRYLTAAIFNQPRTTTIIVMP